MFYLYIKTHNKTGLKYLGKTEQNPYKYPGSGKRWKRHLKKHGKDITTRLLLETDNEKELKETGLFFSKLWNVVESNEWANCKPEEGDGGWSHYNRLGIKHTQETKDKISIKRKGSTRSRESIEKQRLTITGKSRGSYEGYNHEKCSMKVTIYGNTYHSIREACKATGHSKRTIWKRATEISGPAGNIMLPGRI